MGRSGKNFGIFVWVETGVFGVVTDGVVLVIGAEVVEGDVFLVVIELICFSGFFFNDLYLAIHASHAPNRCRQYFL